MRGLLGLILLGAGATAAPARAAVDFARDVQPILAASCLPCHGPDKRQGQLRLDARSLAMKGGVSGPVIVAGNSGESLLVKLLLLEDESERMPRKAAALPKHEIAVLRAWIDQGAVWPDSASADVKIQKHWAYVKPVRPPVPKVKRDAWVRNAIDAFVLARLEQEGLAPAPEASRETLIRRVSLDLTGLPPSPEEVDAFVADRSGDAYAKVVERLLASPHYGERWARLWLDLARYADTNGYEKDRMRTMWKYRDWVIQALNADMPFDRFTLEQVAGDMLPGDRMDHKIASGFHANTMLNEEGGVDPHEARYEVLVDRVNTTGAVWLGSTLACAQCHNHKYDPFSHKEYFRMLAFFDNGVTTEVDKGANGSILIEPTLRVPTPRQAEALRALEAAVADQEQVMATQTPALDEAQSEWVAKTRAKLEAWQTLTPTRVRAAGGGAFVRQRDGSLLVDGPNPAKDVYTIVARIDLRRVTALRLDVLPDARLSSAGPGRGPNGGFMLSEVKLLAAPAARPDDARPVLLAKATADRSGPGSEVADAIDGKAASGWSAGNSSGKPHIAIFEPKAPIESAGPMLVTAVLAHETVHARHGIGRFRLAVTSEPDPAAMLALPARIRELMARPVDALGDAERGEIATYHRSITPLLASVRKEIAKLRDEIDALEIPTAMVVQERPSFERPSTLLRLRGSFVDPGERVFASVPAALHALPDDAPANRLGLARWLVDKDNPLTARVMANRFWEQHFGRGLVETSEDFGSQGGLPTHPALLDWLAIALMEGGWSLKALNGIIVSSATYRQSSQVSPHALAKDPYNRLFTRGPRFRVEAEMIRDIALAASGLLGRKVGGPSVFPLQPDGIWDIPYNNEKWVTSKGEDRHRRGLYTFLKRSAPYPMHTTFDGTSREQCTIRRVRTNTPLQALNLLNDPAFFAAARALGRRMITEGQGDARARATRGFRLVLARRPTSRELDRLVDLYRAESARFEQEGGAEQALDRGLRPRGASASELAAWTLVANVLLNLDETQTKE